MDSRKVVLLWNDDEVYLGMVGEFYEFDASADHYAPIMSRVMSAVTDIIASLASDSSEESKETFTIEIQ